MDIHDLTAANPNPVLELLQGFRSSKVMFAAVELRIFDRLLAGSQSAQSLATAIPADLSALSRLLDTCVGLGLVERTPAGEYANTATAAAYLTHSSPQRMTGYIHYSNDVMWGLWSHLEDAIREGTHRWKQQYGWDGPIFSHFFRTDEAKREFLMGMHGFGMMSSPAVVNAVDLSRFQHLCDLGAATGHLPLAACRRYPELRATVFDLPEVIPLAAELIGAAGLSDRIAVVGGDFFRDPLPAADLYSLGRILHDWSLDKIRVLLKKIAAALPAGGGLLVTEKLLHDDKSGPTWAQLQDLNMLVCTEGCERTVAEYAALLEEAGFSSVTAVRTPTPIDALLAIKR